jgi:hypothetical protein
MYVKNDFHKGFKKKDIANPYNLFSKYPKLVAAT